MPKDNYRLLRLDKEIELSLELTDEDLESLADCYLECLVTGHDEANQDLYDRLKDFIK